jgi:hypothetical protein
LRGDGSVVSGLEDLTASERASVERTLQGRRLELSVPTDLSGRSGTLMSGDRRSLNATAVLIGPMGVVVETDRPEFRWSPRTGDEYRVSVFDEDFSLVAESAWLQTAAWRPTAALQRGQRYSWQLTVRRQDSEFVVPAAPAREARFRIISRAAYQRLQELRKPDGGSALRLAIEYARLGLLRDSERELLRLQADNPQSAIVTGLLASVREASAR